MTDPLDTLRALEAAATPGPWTLGTRNEHGIVLSPEHGLVVSSPWTATGRADNDAALIAAARNALPALLTIARALPEDPGFGGSWCLWCEAPFAQLPHKPDCLWLAASTAKATL